MRLRILHVVHQFLPEHVGGTETYTRALAAAQAAEGHAPVVFARRFGEGHACARETFEGLSVIRAINGAFSAPGRFRDSLHAPRLGACLFETVREVRPDVIHLQHAMGLPAGPLAAIAARVAVVATLHDYWWVCANAQLYTSDSSRVCDGPRAWLNCARCGLARASDAGVARVPDASARLLVPMVSPVFAARAWALRRLARRVAAWIAPTEFVRQWHVARGWPPDRSLHIAHGIEPPDALVLREGRASRDADGRLQVAYLGGLSPQKGVHVLVEAVRSLGDRALLVVAGDEAVFPGYCADLRRAATGNVRFVGLLDQAAVWRTLAASDVVVVPSLWYETSSLIAQESFAAGTPVIASDLGALAERVRDGVDGLRVAPGDADALRRALLRLAEAPELLARLRAGIAPLRTMADHSAEVQSVYESVLTG